MPGRFNDIPAKQYPGHGMPVLTTLSGLILRKFLVSSRSVS
jgi:hypothetical protein